VVTTESIPSAEITAVLGQVYGSIAMNSDPYAARVKRLGDGQFSPAASRELARIRDLAVAQMWSMARGKGANAVIGMRFDNRMLGSDCVEICAYGTAVLVRRVRPRAGQDTPSVDWAQLDRRAAPLATPRGSG